MNRWGNQDDDHPKEDLELEAYYDRKRELHEAQDEKRRVYIGDDKAVVEIHVEQDEDWPGKLYPEWELLDEADNLPGSPEQAGWEKHD